MTTNKLTAALIRTAIDEAGTTLEEHYKAREVIIGSLIHTKIPIVKICDTHIRVEETDPAPYESDQAKRIFRDIANAVEESARADLSDIGPDLALSQDIKLRP